MVTYAFAPLETERALAREMESYATRQAALASQATSEVGQRYVALHQTWPDIAPGALYALAMSGVDPMSDLARDLEQRSILQSQGRGFHSPGEVVSAQQLAREEEMREQSEGSEGGLGESIMGGLRSGVRGAFVGMESAFEAVSRRATSGLVAAQDSDLDYSEALERSTPTMMSMIRSDDYSWEDTGDGWLPGGQIRKDQEDLKHNLTLDGEWMSPGRALAINITEPGTRAFDLSSGLIDAAFRIFGDPAAYATAGLGRLRHANRAFSTDSMLIRGIRRTTDEDYARQWWHGNDAAQRLRQSLTDEQDAYEVWRRLGGAQGKVDHETARLIADARSVHQLDEVILPRLGPGGIAQKPVGGALSRGVARVLNDDIGSVHGLGIHVRRFTDRNVRMAQWMPDATIDTSTPDRALITVDRFLKGVKATDDEAGRVMNRALRIGESGSGETWFDVAMDLSTLAAEKALRDSVTGTRRTLAQATQGSQRRADRAQEIQKFTRIFRERHDELTNYFTSEAGRPRSHVATLVDGQELDLSRVPHLVSEYLHTNLPLPDQQLLRRNIGGYAKAMRTLEDIWEPLGMTRSIFEGVTDTAARFMTSVWKPMVLLRGAYVARVGGEEQLRMGAAGLDSAFRHPLSYTLWLSGRRGGSWRGGMLEDMAEYQSILQRKGGGWIGRKPGAQGTGDWIVFRRGQGGLTDAEFTSAWADDLGMLINDEIASITARMGVDGATDYLLTARGKHLREQLGSADHFEGVTRSSDNLRAYVRTVWDRIEEKTRGDADLIGAIATGRLDGRVVRWVDRHKGEARPDSLVRSLRGRLDSVGIREVKGQRYLEPSRREGVTQQLNAGVDYLADVIMSKPTNFAARGPTWKQEFWNSIEQQIGFADSATQQAIIEQARRAGLVRATIRRMESNRRAGAGSRIDDIGTVEMIAKAQATHRTKQLLYELTELGQFSDASRAAIPFAEAYKEIFVAWGRIVRDRPQTVRRGQVAIEGARGSGFFHTDPSTGEERFTYPGGHFVSRALLAGHADSPFMQAALTTPGVGALATAGLGVSGAMMGEQPAEFDLEGSVAGLNLVGSLAPGFGPAVTIPTSLVLPDTPNTEWLRENVFFPFGEPDITGGVWESALPAWADKIRTAWLEDPESSRLYANSTFDIAKALMASGDYSTDSPEEVDRLLTVAKQRAKGLWLVRGASQFVVPTGPSANFRVQDLEGDWWPYQVLASEYQRMLRDEGEDAAVEEFIATFGTDLISAVQSKSREVVYRPTDQVGDDWIQANRDLQVSYDLTVGLVAPEDPLGEFHYPAYQRQFDEGQREQLDPQQMTYLSNNLLGRFAYSQAVETIDRQPIPENEKRQARNAARAQIMDRYPGFNSHLGVRQRPPVEEQIAEFEQMVEDPRLADNEAVQGIAEYLQARREAERLVQATAQRSTTFRTSSETAWIRQRLRRQAEQIIERNPAFLVPWERALSRELADDEVQQPGELAPLGVLGIDEPAA
ncbi:MAG: hypothetical protein JJT89_06545 [Nitriliruptoraceae bacterium]|nr:hypothetical protein [Nitriliruptoraceae bacterium]